MAQGDLATILRALVFASLTLLAACDLASLEARHSSPGSASGVSDAMHRRLLMQITPSDRQGYSGHQVQPPSGAWAEFFHLTLQDPTLPRLRLRNVENGRVIDRPVVRHALVMTLDIPESRPSALLEMWEVGQRQYDYRVVAVGNPDYGALNNELRITSNPNWNSGRLWIVTDA